MPTTHRLFAALVPPLGAIEHLEDFLAPRVDAAPDLRWSQPHQWHVTLAFAAAVPDWALDELAERVAATAARHRLSAAAIAGAGAFPHPDAARVIWAGVRHVEPADDDRLGHLARGCRDAFAAAGAEPQGGRFRPHLTLARLRRPANVVRWLRVLSSYDGVPWVPGEVTLIASHLGQGARRAPRYEELARCPLAGA